jgi:NAD(P)-dependent dehydrogenase (short-subunit alcohol dehydrogenase family)
MPGMNGALQGRTIVVVGGTSGIGLSAARACCAAGANVVAVGRDDAAAGDAATVLGPRVPVLTGDAVESETSIRAIAKSVAEFGRLDGLYHVAGGSGRKLGDGPLHELTDAGWQRTLDLNLTSLMCSNRAATQQFLKQKSGGSVLNMASVLAYSPSCAHFATHAYAAAKAAIVGLTKSCAAHYAKENIRFNALAPGLVETPMAQRAAADPAIQAFIATKQPLDGGRMAAPGDLDAAAVFFLSDGARFVTGQILAVDGGWSVSDGQLAAAE